VQPAMTGLIAGSLSTLAPIFSSRLRPTPRTTRSSRGWPRWSLLPWPVAATVLPHLTAARGHKTDTSETTRATSRDTSTGSRSTRFAGETVSPVTAFVRA
jgi:hypothetical protein